MAKRKKRVDTRPLNQRVKNIPYMIVGRRKQYLKQRLRIPNKIRFPKTEDETT